MKTLTRIMFYIPKKFLIKLIFFLFLLLSFSFYVNAESLNNVSSSINQACSTYNRFTYSLVGWGDDEFSTGTFKNTITGKANYIVFDFDYDLLKDTSYSLSISAVSTDFRNISKSNTYLEYGSGDCATPTGEIEITNVSFSKSKIVISFKTNQNASRFLLTLGEPYGPAITGVSTFGISSIDITTIETNDTQNIIDNQNQNANAIIDNQQQNTEDIINNNNQNTEDLKDTINDNFNSCVPSKNFFPHSSVSPSGTGGWIHSDYELELKSNTIYTLSTNFVQTGTITTIAILSLDDQTTIKSVRSTATTGSMVLTFTTPEDGLVLIRFYSNYTGSGITTSTEYTNIMLNEGSTALPYEEYGKDVCTNKLDETNDKLDNINGTLNDDTPPDTESFLEHLDDLFDNGPISTLILMPLSLINHYSDGFNQSCSPINLGKLYGTDLRLPCINLESKLGSSLWTTIDGLVSIFMIYNICMLFVSVFNDITSLRDTFDGLYVPQHGKPLGKHTSEVE